LDAAPVDVLALAVLPLLLEVLGVIVGAGIDPEHDAPFGQATLVVLRALLRNPCAHECSDRSAGHAPSGSPPPPPPESRPRRLLRSLRRPRSPRPRRQGRRRWAPPRPGRHRGSRPSAPTRTPASLRLVT